MNGPLSRLALRTVLAALGTACLVGAAQAARVPTDDDEVIERLPARLTSRPPAAASQPQEAIAFAQRSLDLARREGDARYAGQALAALAPWARLPVDQQPAPVLVMRATVDQFLHEFDRAEDLLRAAVARDPQQPQAWITLATVRRVRGRYADSDQACRGLAASGASVHALACLAENQALRGQREPARRLLAQLLARPEAQGDPGASLRAWLLTTRAELEDRAGRPAEAEAALRSALAAVDDPYARLDLADLLLRERRPAEAEALLAREPRSDAVLLRLAIAAKAQGHADDAARELDARMRATAERPGATAPHAREEAMYALDVRGDAAEALRLARRNVELQREPIDLLLLARAAHAAGDPAALAQARKLCDEMGLRDARIDAIG